MQQIPIYFKSDFKLFIRTEAGFAVPFKFEFYTNMPSRPYIAKFDGHKYHNCELLEDGRLCIAFDDHGFGLGKLMIRQSYYLNDADYASEICDRVIAPQPVVNIDDNLLRSEIVLALSGDDTIEFTSQLPPYYQAGLTPEEHQALIDATVHAEEAAASANEQAGIATEAAKAADDARQALTTAYNEKVAALDADYAQKKAALEADYSGVKDALSSDYASVKAQLDADYTATKDALATDYATALAGLNDRMTAIESRFSADREAWNKSVADFITASQATFDGKLTDWQSQVDAAISDITRLQEKDVEQDQKLSELEKTIPNKLDLRSSEGYHPFATTIVNGKVISANSHNPTNSAGNCYTTFNVSPGEKYHIKGYSFNSDYCGIYVHSTSPNTTTKIVIAAGDFDIDLTIPEGKTICSVNGKISGIGALSIEKWVETHQTSEEFYQEFDALSSEVKDAFRPHKYGIEILNNKVNVFIKGYDATHDAFYSFIPKSGNGLWDFYGVGKAVNADKDVRITSPVPADITWLSVGDTDYISPSVVYAKTNADGDFPDTSTQKLTGGWHMYNNATSGNYTPTARNVSFKVFCDGVQVRNSGVRGNNVRIEIVNRLQGSNTEKADGTGREIVEQRFIITFDGFKAIVKGETIALEDVYYHTYYGLSAYYSVSQNSIFFLGSRIDRGGHSPLSSLVRSKDKYGYGIRQLSGTDVFDTVINTSVDVGSFYADRASWSIQISSRKAYPFIIYAANTDVANMLALNAGEQFTWEGYYDIHPSLL